MKPTEMFSSNYKKCKPNYRISNNSIVSLLVTLKSHSPKTNLHLNITNPIVIGKMTFLG